MAYKLSEVEAFRAQVLLEEALNKLRFLANISTSGSHGDELTQFMGDEISRIINEQRGLEKQYEELVAARGQLKGLCNKKKYQTIQLEIKNVSTRLKESNKNLCRNLKENPDLAGNVARMKDERATVQEWLEETKTDLLEFSFQNLATKVEAEKRNQEQLSEMKKKESEASKEVRKLEEDLQKEQADYERETATANREIKDLKEEFQKNQNISLIESKFEQQKLRAREQALLRYHAQSLKKLEEELRELEAAKRTEETVHEQAQHFLEEKGRNLLELKKQWEEDFARDCHDKEVELTVLDERRAAGERELQKLQERCEAEVLKHKQREDEMRAAVAVENEQRDQLQRMADAVLFLQEQGREYMKRLAERKANQKGKKKKGKKK